MKIAINLLPFREKIAGAGKYAKKIVYELSKLDQENDYFLFVSEKGKINFNIHEKNFHFITPKFNPESIYSRILWDPFVFPSELKKIEPDLIFTPSVAIPFLYKGVFYTSIHDLAYKNVKEKYPFLRNIYMKFITNIAAKRSKVIFALTESAKKEIENEFNVKDKKILVTYVGVEDIFFEDFSEQQKQLFKTRYNLPNEFILYVGAIEPGKNLDKLFLAFSQFIKTKPNLRLVLTSGIGWEQQIITDLIKKLNIDNKILFLPYIEEKDLPLLYKCASMLAYLSSYEGFGMPVLEAMAAGTPVLSSKSKAINEFANQAIITADPQNINEVVSGIDVILSKPEIRDEMVMKGKLIAKKFRWSNSAKIILSEFNAYLNRKIK